MRDIEPDSPSTDRPWRRVVLFVLVGIAMSFALRAETFVIGLGFDPDEGVSMLQGRALRAGTLPYVAYFDNRQPLLYANFTIAEALFGERVASGRIWANVNLGLAAAFLGLIVRRLVPGRAPAWVAMALLLALSMSAVPVAMSEAFVLPWTTLAVLLALCAADARRAAARVAWVVASGLALGVAAEVKLLALADGIAVVAAFLIARGRDDARPALRPAGAIGLLATLGVASLVPTLVVAAVYAAAGHYKTFVYASFTYNRIYGATTKFEPLLLAKFLVIFAINSLPLVPLLAAAIVFARRGAPALRLAVPWLIAAFVAACATKRFYAHYSLMLVPALCVAAAAGFEALASLPRPRRRLALAAVAVCFVVPFVGTIVVRANMRGLIARKEQPVTAAIATRVQPGDVVFLGNHDPAQYYATRTEPATSWIFPFWIGDDRWLRVSGLDGHAELDRIVASRPKLISFTHSLGKGWDQATIDYFDHKMRASPEWVRQDYAGQPFEVYVPRDR